MSGTVVNGSDLLLIMNNEPVAHAKSHSVSISSNVIDVSTKDSAEWTEKKAGRLSWSVKVDGLASYDALKCNYETLFDAMTSKTPVTLASSLWHGAASGSPIYSGIGVITSVELTSPDDDNATYSCSFECTQGLTKTSVVAMTLSTVDASSVTDTTATLNGLVNPTGVSAVITFQYTTDLSGSWTSVTATQSPVTASVATAVSKALTGLTGDTTYYFRVKAVNTHGTKYGSILTFTTA